MIWLIVTISINGGPPQVSEKIPDPDMQSCQAEKAARETVKIPSPLPITFRSRGASSV
jgi:hypothetical protein